MSANRIKETVAKIAPLNKRLMQAAQERLDSLTKPQGSLGKLEDIARQICGITGKENPELKNKVIFTLAADHGIAEAGVSAFPKEVTAQMVYNFLRGGAGINVLANHIGAKVVIVDMGVAEELKTESVKCKNFRDRKIAFGTKNFVQGPAMSREQAVQSIETGIELFKKELPYGVDIVGTGEMGIANTTSSSAIAACITKRKVSEVTGRGTGINDTVLKNKAGLIEKALLLNNPNPSDPIDVLSKVGGFEIGGLSGIILSAASRKIPVVIDGFISGAAALIAYGLAPEVKNYLFAAHSSVEIGHQAILQHIGVEPILNLNLRLGEGTGAALGINIIEAAVKILTQMASFKDVGVSEKI